MTTDSPTDSPNASGHVTIVFTSDWGVSTGVGQAGRTHSTIERCGDDPVVRGTVITGVLREQAMLAAKALDGPEEKSPKKWTSFALWLFGQDPDSEPGSTPHPRHVLFTDATPASKIPIHDTVFLSIDPTTGTARDQFLRFTERAAAGVLTGTFTLIDEAGAETSDQETIKAAHFLLGVAGLMVRGIGSGRSGGDGECTVLVTSHEDYAKPDLQDEEAADALKRILANRDNDSPTYSSEDVKTVAGHLRSRARESLQEVPDLPKDLLENSPQDIALPSSQPSESGDTTWYETSLDIVLDTPVVSYEVPFSNEVRSLDFLRGTVLVPWLHNLLRKKYRGMDSAIVSGDLRISDALAVYKGVAGLPVPFVVENEKVPEDKLKDKQDDQQPCTLFNRHIPISDQVCGDHTIPTRGSYLFVKSNGAPVTGWIGKPSLIGRQSTAINSETGAAKDGQLFLVRALPAGLTLHASVVVSKQLLSELRGTDATSEASPLTLDLGIAEQPTFLGSRKLTGTFGRARCTVGTTFTRVGSTPPPVEGPVTDEGTQASSCEPTKIVSLWFTSDVLARSSTLGPGGSVEDLEFAFRRANVPVTIVQESPDQDSGDKNRKRILTSIRHRRVDSWSPRDNAPRATRLAIQAGSVVQVRLSPQDLGALEALGTRAYRRR